MKYAVITENDESNCDEVTGVSYNYPAKYSRLLLPGAKFIYYKGRLSNKQFENELLSNQPYCFGAGIIGGNYLDQRAEKKEFYCDILKYEPLLYPGSRKFDFKSFAVRD